MPKVYNFGAGPGKLPEEVSYLVCLAKFKIMRLSARVKDIQISLRERFVKLYRAKN